ncbi:MAG: hypothetical protein SFU98_00340 [Leptospiraceae bacterium]|nr:hypothetical protein [Leptospiraceae bacterium]
MNHWEELGIPFTKDTQKIKKAYSIKLKLIDRELHPEKFTELRNAYEIALDEAQYSYDEENDLPEGQSSQVYQEESLIEDLTSDRVEDESIIDDSISHNVQEETNLEENIDQSLQEESELNTINNYAAYDFAYSIIDRITCDSTDMAIFNQLKLRLSEETIFFKNEVEETIINELYFRYASYILTPEQYPYQLISALTEYFDWNNITENADYRVFLVVQKTIARKERIQFSRSYSQLKEELDNFFYRGSKEDFLKLNKFERFDTEISFYKIIQSKYPLVLRYEVSMEIIDAIFESNKNSRFNFDKNYSSSLIFRLCSGFIIVLLIIGLLKVIDLIGFKQRQLISIGVVFLILVKVLFYINRTQGMWTLSQEKALRFVSLIFLGLSSLCIASIGSEWLGFLNTSYSYFSLYYINLMFLGVLFALFGSRFVQLDYSDNLIGLLRYTWFPLFIIFSIALSQFESNTHNRSIYLFIMAVKISIIGLGFSLLTIWNENQFLKFLEIGFSSLFFYVILQKSNLSNVNSQFISIGIILSVYLLKEISSENKFSIIYKKSFWFILFALYLFSLIIPLKLHYSYQICILVLLSFIVCKESIGVWILVLAISAGIHFLSNVQDKILPINIAIGFILLNILLLKTIRGKKNSTELNEHVQ